MQNARVIQLGSSNVKVTRNSASFDEAFGGYSSKRKQKFSNATGNIMNFESLYPFSVKGSKGTVKTFAKGEQITLQADGYPLQAFFKIDDEIFNIDPSFVLNPTTSKTYLGIPISLSGDSAQTYLDFAKSYRPIYDLKSKGSFGTIKTFPKNVDIVLTRSYKKNPNGSKYDIQTTFKDSNNEIFDINPAFVKDPNNLNVNAYGLVVTYPSENILLDSLPTSSITTGTNTQTSALTQLLSILTLEKITRFTTDKPLMPLYQGFYKVVSDVNGVRDNGLSKKFLKDTILEGYLQTFDNPTTGGKSGYWVVQSEVPTTVGNASTTTASPSNNPSNAPVTNLATSTATSGTATGTATTGGTATSVGTSSGTSTGTQSSPNPNATLQAKSNATGTTMASFKLPLYALVPAPIGGTTVSLDPNQGGGTNTGGGNQDPNQSGGVYTGGGNSSADLDALNAQIEANQLAQMQQQGEGMPQQGYIGYTPSQEELMVDIDTNYAPDTEIESSFDGYGNSNAMETMINDLCTKIAWNKEMAEMLKNKKGVDKSELKSEYIAKVDRVNELLKELKSYETPANREYIKKMLYDCDMMRPSMKKTMPNKMVIQNTNPKVISLGNTNPSEFKNDLGNTIMEDEDSSFMGDVIEYSDFNGSATSTALIGVGIGAVLGVIGIVVIKKMGK